MGVNGRSLRRWRVLGFVLFWAQLGGATAGVFAYLVNDAWVPYSAVCALWLAYWGWRFTDPHWIPPGFGPKR